MQPLSPENANPPESWSPLLRLAAGAAAGYLILLGGRQRGLTRWTLLALGSVLGLQSAMKVNLARSFGIALTPMIELNRKARIHAPMDFVFDFLKDFSNFPRFMSFVENVQVNEQEGLTWKVRAPAGTTVKWNARLVRLSPHGRIAWQSLPGSPITNRGDLRFHATKAYDWTELEVRLIYAPPAGAIGYAVAHFLGFDPKTRIDGDIAKMKTLIESEFNHAMQKRKRKA